MVTQAQNGPDSHRYFATKPHQSPVARKGSQRSPQAGQKLPLAPHNSQTTPQRQQPNNKPKMTPSAAPRPIPTQRPKTTSPKPIPNNHPSHTPSNRSSPSRSSPSRSSPSRNSPSRSSPNNFANSTCYQPPTPSSLPKPPVAWTRSAPANLPSPAADPSAHLRLLLNVQA